MAVIQKRKDVKGNTRYCVLIRKAGQPTISKHLVSGSPPRTYNKTETALEKGEYRAEKALVSTWSNRVSKC